jgi:hypothetical protein
MSNGIQKLVVGGGWWVEKKKTCSLPSVLRSAANNPLPTTNDEASLTQN